MITYKDVYTMITNYITAAVHIDCIYLYCDTCPRRSWCFCDSYILAVDYIARGDY